jgi:hypothetical protein
MTNNDFQAAIARKDWDAVEAVIAANLDDDTSRDGLHDWLEEGSYTGNETPESVAAEWMELDQQVEGIDY